MIAYEIHTHRDGQWKMDSVFDDRAMAMHEARKADDSNRYAGIRLIEESYDESTGRTTTRIIFRGGWTDRQTKARRAQERKPAPPRAQPGTGKEPVRTARQPDAPKGRSLAVPVLVTLIVLAAGLMGLLILYRLSHGG